MQHARPLKFVVYHRVVFGVKKQYYNVIHYTMRERVLRQNTVYLSDESLTSSSMITDWSVVAMTTSTLTAITSLK